MRKTVLLLLCLAAVLPVSAKTPLARVEWGLFGGINIPDYSTSDDYSSIKNKLGWQFGILTAVKLGPVAVEPQILYVRQGLRIRTVDVNRSISVPIPSMCLCWPRSGC